MADTFLPVQANSRPPAWSIYAQQLFHHRYGYPLWMPEYDPRLGEVAIGDVGWINEGGFYPLFNSLKSKEERQPRDIVPECHEPMNLASIVISDNRKTITQPLLCGGSIKQVKASATLAANGSHVDPYSPSAGAHFGFECSTDAGAFLLLAPPTVSRQIQSKKHIADYMRRNFPQWSELANSHFGLGLKDEEIMYVSGTTKTSKWAVAAFHGEYRRKEGAITADFGSLMGIDISVSISDEMLPSSYYRTGPGREQVSLSSLVLDTNEPALSAPPQECCDQCIFLHYYKMKRRLGWKPTPIQAAGGPHELPPRDPDGGDDVLYSSCGDAGETVNFDEGFGKPFDPVNDILDYILEHSQASVALASDTDVYELREDFSENMAIALSKRRPRIEVDENGVGFLSIELPDRLSHYDLPPPYSISPSIDESCLYQTTSGVCDDVDEIPRYAKSEEIDKFSSKYNELLPARSSFETMQSMLRQRFYDDAFRMRSCVPNVLDQDKSKLQSNNSLTSNKFSFPPPMSAPPTQTAFPQRYPTESRLARIAVANPTLHRYEPGLGAGRQTFNAQLPSSQRDTFAYSAASSASATIVQSSPLSPRPSSSSSSYSTYKEHQRGSNSASLDSANLSDPHANSVATWCSKLKQSDLEADAHLTSSLPSHLYAGSAASFDVSATGTPSPPVQIHHYPYPLKDAAISPWAGAKAQRGAPVQASEGSAARPSGNSNKTYSFVSLPGNAVKKRSRGRYYEIERLYQCSWPDCTKAYGTLNHLNAHVTMQRHGPKRTPDEFKELRMKWRQDKKEADEAEREHEREAAARATAMQNLQHRHAHQYQPTVYDDRRSDSRQRTSTDEPSPGSHRDGHGPHALPHRLLPDSATQRQAGRAVQPFGDPPQTGPAYGSLQDVLH